MRFARPIGIQENLGQFGDGEAAYHTDIPGGAVAFYRSRLEITLWMAQERASIEMTFPASNVVMPVAKRIVPGMSHYLIGNDPNRWTPDVRTFEEIVYRDLWTGIDLSITSEVDGLKYTFKVRPCVEVSLIQINVDGHESLRVDTKGDLIISTIGGELVDSGLVVFYEDRPSQHIDASFSILGEDVYGSSLARYDTNRSVVIDPLLFSTFLGGNQSDYIRGIAVDSQGFIYLAGVTGSRDFPGLSGSNESEQLIWKGFITKLTQDGASVLFTTFLGGNNSSEINSIAVDFLGFIHVTGVTQSGDFPVTDNAYQNETVDRWSRISDAFVTKLSRDGRSLVYSTYLSGGTIDYGNGIDVDNDGFIYITGSTRSRDFPVTDGAYQTTYGGSWGDAFVAKIDPSDGTVHYVTYLGGSSDDYGADITVDQMGSAYIAGNTWSRDFVTSPEAPQRTHGGGQADGFIAKLNPTGDLLVYSTYIGGSDRDRAYGIAIDGVGNAFVCGITSSDDLPTTEGAYLEDADVDKSAFVCRLRHDGSVFEYVSYTGGGEWDWANDIAIDRMGCAYIVGETCSENFPTTKDAINETMNGPCDAYIMKFDPTGSDLLYASFLGGGSYEDGNAIVLDLDDKILVAGSTRSDDFPISNGTLQDDRGGGVTDGFLVRIDNEVEEAGSSTTSQWREGPLLALLLFSVIVVAVVIRLRMEPSEPPDEA